MTWALDTTPVPLARRCRGRRHRLFADEAAIGRGGSDRDWRYGCKLLLSVTPEGVVTGFLLAPANTEDRWLAESFFCWRNRKDDAPVNPLDLPRRRNGRPCVGPTGPVGPRWGVGEASGSAYLADDGFFGAWWQSHWREDCQAATLTPKNCVGTTAPWWRQQHHRRRQIVETVNGWLEEVFHLPFPRARSRWGLLTRVAAKVAALNLGIRLNRLLGRPGLAFATLFNG